MHDGGTHPQLRVGDPAPDFSLPNQWGESVSLAGLRGAPVALVFYPFAFSGVCTAELGALRDNLAGFTAAGVRLLAVSVDSKYTLRAYAGAEDYPFDLLADFWPHGAVARAYGAFNSTQGMSGRNTFLITADGLIGDTFSTSPGQARSVERYWQALARL